MDSNNTLFIAFHYFSSLHNGSKYRQSNIFVELFNDIIVINIKKQHSYIIKPTHNNLIIYYKQYNDIYPSQSLNILEYYSQTKIYDQSIKQLFELYFIKKNIDKISYSPLSTLFYVYFIDKSEWKKEQKYKVIYSKNIEYNEYSINVIYSYKQNKPYADVLVSGYKFTEFSYFTNPYIYDMIEEIQHKRTKYYAIIKLSNRYRGYFHMFSDDICDHIIDIILDV